MATDNPSSEDDYMTMPVPTSEPPASQKRGAPSYSEKVKRKQLKVRLTISTPLSLPSRKS